MYILKNKKYFWTLQKEYSESLQLHFLLFLKDLFTFSELPSMSLY